MFLHTIRILSIITLLLPLHAFAQRQVTPRVSPTASEVERGTRVGRAGTASHVPRAASEGAPRTRDGRTRVYSRSPDDPSQFILDRGIQVEDHPNDYARHADFRAPLASECDLATSTPCAQILRTLRLAPVSGVAYHASVPPRVQLRGPEPNISWVPSVHCITYEPRRRSRYKVGSGPSCMNIVDAETQQMEWLIGGHIEGLDKKQYGVYEGWVPVSFTMGEYQWIMDIPITYERFKRQPTCGLGTASDGTPQGNIRIRNIPHRPGFSAGEIRLTSGYRVRTAIEYIGDYEDLCKAEPSLCADILDNSTTGWIRLLADEDAQWTINITGIKFTFLDGSTADWEWIVGYYDDVRSGAFPLKQAKEPTFTESTDPNIYFNSEREAHLYLGGVLTLANTSNPQSNSCPRCHGEYSNRPRTYKETATVTLTCM